MKNAERQRIYVNRHEGKQWEYQDMHFEMNDLRMIVTDIDSTLLRSDKTVSDYSVSAFERLRERGILVAFATARYFRTVEEWLIPAIGIRPDIVISVNGAYAYTKNRVLYKAVLSQDIGNELLTAVRKAGGKVTAGTDTVRYCEREIDSTHRGFSKYYDFENCINEDIHYFDVRGIERTVVEQIVSNYPSIRIQGYSDTELVSIQNKDARKELALSAVSRELCIPPKSIISFGDDRNDIEMLRMCGASVVVGNAIDEVKAIADYMCDTNDNDGVAKWISQFVLM